MPKESAQISKAFPDVNEDPESSRINLENLDFSEQAAAVLNHFAAIAEDIKAKDQLKREKSPHPLAHVKLTTSIDSRLQQASDDLDVLITIYERITSIKRNRKKYSDEQIRKFEETLRTLESQYNTYESRRYNRSLGSKKRIKLDLSSTNEEVTADDQVLANESMQRWRKRDEEFDKQLHEIGEAVDRIGTVAITIGEKATEQTRSAIETASKVQETKSDITAMSAQIKRVLRRQRQVEFTLRIGLILTFLTLVSVFIFLLFKFIRS